MPKIKTRRAAAKRLKISGSGRIKCGKAGHRHLQSGKTTKRKRQLRAAGIVPAQLVKAVNRQLPYG